MNYRRASCDCEEESSFRSWGIQLNRPDAWPTLGPRWPTPFLYQPPHNYSCTSTDSEHALAHIKWRYTLHRRWGGVRTPPDTAGHVPSGAFLFLRQRMTDRHEGPRQRVNYHRTHTGWDNTPCHIPVVSGHRAHPVWHTQDTAYQAAWLI